MYPHFVEIHSNKDPQMEFMLNVDHINYFYVNEDGVTKIMLSGLRYEEISETYDELKELIRSAGCHIEKGDPRLDQTKPLTMADLKHMIGEPVWNSNTRCWMLVSEDRGDTVYLIFNNGNGYDFHENALIKYPLYRMVQR